MEGDRERDTMIDYEAARAGQRQIERNSITAKKLGRLQKG